MPKRSRFEAIPTNPLSVADMQVASASTARRMWRRATRIVNNAALDNDPGRMRMDLMRSFGLNNDEDRVDFAVQTGRLQFIQRAIRTALDRRRRQAYLILRRILPIELSRNVLRVNRN